MNEFFFVTWFCRISVTFVGDGGEETTIKVPVGMSMLEAAHENDIELEGKHLNNYFLSDHELMHKWFPT